MAATALKPVPFTARQLLELDACARCGECVAWCPTFEEGRRELTHPQGKIDRLRSWVRRHYGLRARILGPQTIGVHELAEYAQGVYDCTLCGRCGEVCPVRIDTRALWLAMRTHLVEIGRLPAPLAALRSTVAASHNLAGQDNAFRLAWSENLPAPALPALRPAEVVYFVGCVAAFYPQAYPVPQSLAQLLQHAGVDWTVLGGEEWCCGFPLLSAGLRAEAADLARHNVAAVRALGARTLVATCPSCYRAWRDEYPRLIGEPLGFEVRHATEVLADLVAEGRLALGPYPHRLTYHDPCDLGRGCGLYGPPRRLLQAIPGVDLSEMRHSRELALCCGGGGDVELGNPALTAGIARRRLAQAQETGAEILVSACQQCRRTLAAAARRDRSTLRVLDVVEVLWQSVGARET